MAIDLKHLRVLVAIDKHGTMSGAARELGYSQPAVSQQIAQAERLLGVPLLNRSRAGVTLTHAGEVLLRGSQPVLTQVGQLVAEVGAIAGHTAGKVRVASFSSAAATILPGAFAKVREDFPEVQFELIQREPYQALEMLRAGACDVAIVYDFFTDGDDMTPTHLQPEERSFTLFEESMLVALPKSHSMANQDRIDLTSLADENWIAGCLVWKEQLTKLCETAGFTPNFKIEIEDHVPVQGLVEANLGVAMFPELAATAGDHSISLELLPCEPAAVRTVRAITTHNLLSIPGVFPTVEALRHVGRAFVSVD